MFLTSILVMSLSSLAIAADQNIKPADSPAKPEPQPGWIVVEEDIWIRLNDEPSHHMRLAHESFLRKEYETTVSELRKSGAYLHVLVKNASSETKAALKASAHELDRLADEVHAGTVKSVKSLEAACARAEHALAARNHAKAQSALKENHHKEAGDYLHSAVNNVENAAQWSGHELESGAVEMGKSVRIVAGKLKEGGNFVVDEAGKGIKWVGDEVKKLGTFIEPHQPVKPASKAVTKE